MQNIIKPFFSFALFAVLILTACKMMLPSPSVWEKRLSPPVGGVDAGPLIGQAFGELRVAAHGGRIKRAVLRFDAGEYPLSETLVLNRAVLGDFQGELVLEGPVQGQAVLHGSVAVEGWQPATTANLSAEANGNVWVAPLPAGPTKVLFDGQGMLSRARSLGFTPTQNGATLTGFGFPAGLLPADETVEGLELSVRPSWLWIHNILPLASLSPSAGRGTTGIPATYPIAPMKNWGSSTSPSAWFENRTLFIRKPGNWATCPDGQHVYLWPREGASPAGVRAARLIELVRIEGDEAAEKPLANITLRRLTFSQAERESIAPNDAGLQHDWDFYDKANAMLRLRWVENITVENCHFIESGAAGLRADLYVQNVRVLGNTFRNLGGGGILFCGYGPGTRDVNKNNKVHGNLIENCGRLIWHSPGIHLWQSGDNKVSRNLLRDLPYTGIIVSGNAQFWKMNPEQRVAPDREQMRTVRWDETGTGPHTVESIQPFLHSRNNLIAGNEITRVMNTMGDGNGIYIRFSSQTGNVIRGNYVHDITGSRCAGGIRCDDLQNGVVIEGNMIDRVTHGGLFFNGARGTMRNNFIVDILNPGNSDTHPFFQGYIILWNDLVHGSIIERNVIFDTGNGSPEFYCRKFATWLPGARPPELGEIELRDNLYWVQGNPSWAENFVAENRAASIDPGSVATNAGMQRNATGRPIFNLEVLHSHGIEPFQWDQVGLP